MLDLGTLGLKISVDSSELKQIPEEAKVAENGINRLGTASTNASRIIKRAFVGLGLAKIGKDILSSYADFQQFSGGIEKLFGDSAEAVMRNAEEAYKTAGISVNKYLDQTSSFAASLIKSLGGDTAKAAELANTAMIDMSDNANMFGTSIDSIAATYQSLARGNYAMLDNLKLGYGGTKAELQKLLNDAEEYNRKQGKFTEYQIDNYADIVDAIHTIQVAQKVSGTTAEEAEKTISGSLNMVKASWENLLSSFANPEADIDRQVNTFVDSLSTFANNIVPVIVRAIPNVIEGVGQIIDALVYEISKEENKTAIKEAIITLLKDSAEAAFTEFPGLSSAAVAMFVSKLLPTGLIKKKVLAGAGKAGKAAGKAAGGALGTGMVKAATTALSTAVQSGAILGGLVGLGVLVDKFLKKNFPDWYDDTYGIGGTAYEQHDARLTRDGEFKYEPQPKKGWKQARDTVDDVLEIPREITTIINSDDKASEKIAKVMQHYDELPSEVQSILSAKDSATNKVKKLQKYYSKNPKNIVTKLDAVDRATEKLTILMRNLNALPKEKRISVVTTYKKINQIDSFSPSGQHRIGIREVPYDGYLASLHKGETILTATETNKLVKNADLAQTNQNIEINFNGTYGFNNKKDIDYFMSEAQKMVNRRLSI